MSAISEELLFQGQKLPLKAKEDLVSVIIPVYNEEKCLEDVVSKLKETMIDANLKFEIIMVDDGSTDQSGKIIKGIKGIRAFSHAQNIGYGAALKTGLKKAAGNIIVITDADGTYPIEIIPVLVKEIDEYDMAVGARSMNDKSIPLVRKPMKWVLGKLANYLSGTNIPDLNSGLRAFRKDVAFRFFKMYPSGFSFTTTITLAMHCDGYDVKYIPIKYGKREGKSKINPIKDTINFIQLIWRTVMYFNPLKVFLPIAGFILIGFLASSYYDVFILDDLTEKTLILFLAFLQIIVIGLLADLIDKRGR
jgi:glycosyltransferase involved in cell wall biosynthesis